MHIKLLLPTVLLSLTAATLCSAAAIDNDPIAVTRRLKPAVGTVTTPDGTVLSYRLFNHTQPSYANATPVIFVSGLGQVQTDWDALIPHFTKKHPVLAFDNRGIGLSTVTNSSLVTRQNMGNDIHELIKHFGWTHINLVGISMGAIVSNTFMASDFTDVQVDHLVLIAGAYKDSSTGPLIQDVGRWLESFSTTPPPASEWKAFIHKLMLACLTPDYVNTHPSRIRQFLRQVDQGKGRTYEKFIVQAGAMGQYDLSESLKGYEARGVKTMVMHGKLDVAIPVEVGRAMSELIGGGVTYKEYPDGGHVLYETDPESVEDIVAFLDGEE